jgi:hypothetical protein
VAIVLDPDFGERISEVGQRMAVWLTPSAENRDAAVRLRKLLENDPDAPVVSMWSEPRTGASEKEWLGILQTIEMHHGEYAAERPVTELHIFGGSPEPHVVAALHAFGYTRVAMGDDGSFTASREV